MPIPSSALYRDLEPDILAAESFYDEQTDYQYPVASGAEEDDENYIPIDIDVISGAEILDEERRLRSALHGKGRLVTGCREIDDAVLRGGLERGRIVGVSSEREDFALLVGLQTVANLLVKEPGDGRELPSAMIITTLPHEELLPTLRNVVKGQVETLPDVKDARARVISALERISVSRVFDYDGLRESLDELYLPGEHPLTSGTPPPSARVGPPKDDYDGDEADNDNIDMSHHHPPLHPPLPDTATLGLEVPEHKPPERQQAYTDENTQSRERELRPDMVLITNMPALLTSLYATREEENADAVLRSLRRRLRYLTLTPAHGGPLFMLLNSAKVVVTGPDDPEELFMDLDDLEDLDADEDISPPSSPPGSQQVESGEQPEELPSSMPVSPGPTSPPSAGTPSSPSPIPRNHSPDPPPSPSPLPKAQSPFPPPEYELKPATPTSSSPSPPPQPLSPASSATARPDSSPAAAPPPPPRSEPSDEQAEVPPGGSTADSTAIIEPGRLPFLTFDPRHVSVFQRPPYPPENIELAEDGGCLVHAEEEEEGEGEGEGEGAGLRLRLPPPRFWIRPFFAQGIADLVDLHLMCTRVRKGGEEEKEVGDGEGDGGGGDGDGDEQDEEVGGSDDDHDNDEEDDDKEDDDGDEEMADKKGRREDRTEVDDGNPGSQGKAATDGSSPRMKETETQAGTEKEQDMVWVVEMLLDDFGLWDDRKRSRQRRDERWGAVEVSTSEDGVIRLVDAGIAAAVGVGSGDGEESGSSWVDRFVTCSGEEEVDLEMHDEEEDESGSSVPKSADGDAEYESACSTGSEPEYNAEHEPGNKTMDDEEGFHDEDDMYTGQPPPTTTMEYQEDVNNPGHLISKEEAALVDMFPYDLRPAWAEYVGILRDCGPDVYIPTYVEYAQQMLAPEVEERQPLSEGDPELEYWGGEVPDEPSPEHSEHGEYGDDARGVVVRLEYQDEWVEYLVLMEEAGCLGEAMDYEEYVESVCFAVDGDSEVQYRHQGVRYDEDVEGDGSWPGEHDKEDQAKLAEYERSLEEGGYDDEVEGRDLQAEWEEQVRLMEEAGCPHLALTYEEYLAGLNSSSDEDESTDEGLARPDLEADWAEYFFLMDEAGVAGEALSYEEYLEEIDAALGRGGQSSEDAGDDEDDATHDTPVDDTGLAEEAMDLDHGKIRASSPTSNEDGQSIQDGGYEDEVLPDADLFDKYQDLWAEHRAIMDEAGCLDDALTFAEYIAVIAGHPSDHDQSNRGPEEEYWGEEGEGGVPCPPGPGFDYWAAEGLEHVERPPYEYEIEREEEVDAFMDAEEDLYWSHFVAGWDGDVSAEEYVEWEAYRNVMEDVRLLVEDLVMEEGGGEAEGVLSGEVPERRDGVAVEEGDVARQDPEQEEGAEDREEDALSAEIPEG